MSAHTYQPPYGKESEKTWRIAHKKTGSGLGGLQGFLHWFGGKDCSSSWKYKGKKTKKPLLTTLTTDFSVF